MAKIGRPGYQDEIKTREIIDLSIPVIKRALQDEELPLQFRAEIASRFVLKIIPSGDKIENKNYFLSVNAELNEIQSSDLRAIIEAGRSGIIPPRTDGASEVRQIDHQDKIG